MGRGRSAKTIKLLEAAKEILERIQPASVRAVCYQLFNQGWIDSMEVKNTGKVGKILTTAREEHVIPWEWIVQEGRSIESIATWENPESFARGVMLSYRRDKWQSQKRGVIVVSEKGTIRGTLEPVLDEFEVDFLPVGGFSSATRIKELADIAESKDTVILYLGDYDPSGLYMSFHDIPQRLMRYGSDSRIEFKRIALTDSDTAEIGNHLSFLASEKSTDPRYKWFVQNYGDACWELDAMNPVELRRRVKEAIESEINFTEWNRYLEAEKAEKNSIMQGCQLFKSILNPNAK